GVEGGGGRRAEWGGGGGRGMGILAISTPACVGSRGGAADLRRRRRQYPDRTADRVLEEIARFNRRGASHRPWNGNNTGALPTRYDGHDQSRADHHEPAQPDPGGDDRARPRRRRRAHRDVARPSPFVSWRYAGRGGRASGRDLQRPVLVVQLTLVRPRGGLPLCVWCRPHRRDDVGGG